jgi:hypothetical protein
MGEPRCFAPACGSSFPEIPGYHPDLRLTIVTLQTEFELLQEDFKEIVKNHLYLRSARRFLNILRIIVAAVLGFCAILTAVAGETTWAICFGFVCLVVVGVLILAPRLAVRSLQNTPFYKGKVRVQADDSGTRFVYETGDSNTQWSGYIRFLETKNLFILYVSKVMFRPIPKRALSPGQVSELREMLQKKIASPGK